MTIGPLMLDLEGTELKTEERELLRHPVAGGVILFSRNYSDPQQLARLCAQIHELRDPHLLIAVDQEGGRVQRFREGFTQLPAAARIGTAYHKDAASGRRLCRETAWLMATELRAVGVDFSFAPVLDLDIGISEVIGDRSFDAEPEPASDLAMAWMSGSHEAGMAVVGKHFPGHGQVQADSHLELPRDLRPIADLRLQDLVPFERMVDAGMEAVMPAHVLYSAIDAYPAGFSRFWLQDILRGELGFQGVIFSDDLSMQAADLGSSYAERAHAAIAAGCDMVLACNNRPGAVEVLDALNGYNEPASQLRLARMHGRKSIDRGQMHLNPRWHQVVRLLADLDNAETLPLALE